VNGSGCLRMLRAEMQRFLQDLLSSSAETSNVCPGLFGSWWRRMTCRLWLRAVVRAAQDK
jgi:hypothetical protein